MCVLAANGRPDFANIPVGYTTGHMFSEKTKYIGSGGEQARCSRWRNMLVVLS